MCMTHVYEYIEVRTIFQIECEICWLQSIGFRIFDGRCCESSEKKQTSMMCVVRLLPMLVRHLQMSHSHSAH